MNAYSASMSEATLQDAIIQYAQLKGWKVHHNWTELHSPKGWPDLVFCRLSRLVMVELKSEKGKVTPEQQEWLDLLEATGKAEVYIWKPEDWLDGTVEGLLE